MNSNFINGLAEHIKNHYDLKKEELTIVFPNKRAAFYLRLKFKEIYTEEIWLPQILSIEEAMTQWSGIQLVDSVDMLFELISINSESYGSQKEVLPNHRSNSINVFGSIAAQMAKDFDEIDQYGVDADHLFSYINDLKRLGTWSVEGEVTDQERQYLIFFEKLKLYYDLLRERLEKRHKGYYGMITRQLASLPDSELLARTRNKKIIFAGFNALTPTEQKIIDKLYKAGQTEVVWDFDHYYVDNEQNEAGSFARSYIKNDVPWKPKPTDISNTLLTDEKEIHLVEVNGNTVQAKALQSLLQMEDNPNVAVILADEKLMIPTLNSIPEDNRFANVSVSMGYPLKQTALDHLIMEFFTLHRKGRKVRDEGWYLWPILRVMDTELVQVLFNKEELHELSEYHTYILNSSAFIYKEEVFARYCKSEDLQVFMRLLLHDGLRPADWIDSLRALLVFIANRLQQRDKQDGIVLFLLNQVSEVGKVINRLKDIMERYPGYVATFDELEVLYRLVSSGTSIKLNGSSNTGLQLMGLLEARNLDFDTLYMVGVNESILPAGKSYNSFIPYNIRKECGLPDDREKQAVYAYHFYRQLQGAKKMYFIYNTNSGDTGSEPSRFLLQLKYELATRNPLIHLHEELFAPKTKPDIHPQRLTANKTDDVMALLMQKLQPQFDYQALAPTSLSAYIQCPFKFYLKYLMKIVDNRIEEDTQNNVIGSVVHETLQALYKDYCGTEVNLPLFTKAIEPSLDRKLAATIGKHFAQGLPDVGYNYLNKLTIKKLFDNYIQFEKKELADHGISFIALEKLMTTALTVNGVSCKLSGTADRIDCCRGVTRIIDYKTGLIDEREVKVPSKIETLRDIPEKALQLLIYKYLYLKSNPTIASPDAVTAALFGLRNQQVCFELKVDNKALNDDFMGVMEQMLTETLQTMMDRSIPFSQPDDTKVIPCHFCDFKEICVNTEVGSRLANDR